MALLERATQLRAATSYLEEAASGRGRMLYVAGEAGIGKTAFVEELARTSGAHVAIGWCDGSTTPPPLGPLIDMLPELPEEVWPDGASRATVFSRLLSILRQASASPYLLVIEDAHWADEATLDLIRHLARRIHGCHALVVVTYRPEDTIVGDGLRLVLGDTASAGGTRRIDLPPLTATAVATLVTEHASDPGGPADVERLHRVTGGNPFFVTEALSAGTGDVPGTVRDAVLSRVARLDERSQQALELIALVGARAESGLLDALLGEGMTSLDEPLSRGLLRRSGGDVAFRHELARLAVLSEIPAGRAVGWHRRLLAALEDLDADPARLAHHAEAAHDGDAVLRHAPVAAERAAALGAHQEALRQYRRALGFGDRLAPLQRAELLWSVGYECYLTGRIDTAIEAVDQARGIWDELGETVRVGDAWRCASRLHWFAGRNLEAKEQADRAVDLLEGSGTYEQALAYSHRAGLQMLASDLDGTRRWGRQTLELVGDLPPGQQRDEVRVHALNNLGTMEMIAGDATEGERMLLASLEEARAVDLHEHAARAFCNLGSCAVAQHRYVDAERHLEQGIEYCVDRDLDSWSSYLLGWRARMFLDRGEYEAARADAHRVLDRLDSDAVSTIQPLLVLGQLASRTASPDTAALLGRATALAEDMKETQRLAPTATARAENAWIRDAPDDDWTVRAWEVVSTSDCPWNKGVVATWLPREVVVTDLLAPPYAAERAGRWREAAGIWEQLGCPFHAGLALARSGDADALVEAVGIFDRDGSTAAAARARADLRALGERPPRATRAARHPDGLTDREAEVLTLLREGLTDAAIADRLVISRRTAEHHVGAILAKLGANGRAELADVGSDDATSG